MLLNTEAKCRNKLQGQKCPLYNVHRNRSDLHHNFSSRKKEKSIEKTADCEIKVYRNHCMEEPIRPVSK